MCRLSDMDSGKMLTCATCGNEEPEDSRFCGSCSAPFVPADQLPAHTAMSSGVMLTCATCGHEEPEGSQFCGNCSAPFVPVEQVPAHTESMEAALAPETPSPQPAAKVPTRVAPPPTPPPRGKRRLRWVAAGAAVVLLVAGGAVAAVLSLTGGDDAAEGIPTEQQPLPAATSESLPPASNPTLVDSISPHFGVLAESQGALNARVRSLRAGVESFAALRQAADALAARVVGTQEFLDGLTPTDSAETGTLLLLHRALAAHLAYADAISSFPPRPRSFTNAQAQAAIARAEQMQVAYSTLAAAEPGLSGIALSSFDHVRFLELVPSATQTFSTAGRLVIDLVPLLVGIRPDDPLGEGRCFGPYTSRASLRVSGVVHGSGFIQCGDDADGDPSRTSGVYRFSSRTFRAASKVVRLTGQAVIDESSSSSQRGSSVTWTVFYNGTRICSETVVWSASRPSPRELDCRFPLLAAAGGFDVGRLRIEQVASLASSGSLWAGLLNPKIVAEVPR